MTRQMQDLIKRQNQQLKNQRAPVKVATKKSMALFNKHFKKTGEKDYSLLKYKEVRK